MGEKTEAATPKKLRDARKKGQVAKSQDLPSAFTFIVSIWATISMSVYLYHYMGDFVVLTFKRVTDPQLDVAIVALFYEAISVILYASLPLACLVAIVGVIVNFLAVGPVFATEVFKFDIKKFDPIQNLKAKFKMKTLVELVKSILKIGVACYLIYNTMYDSLPTLILTAKMPMVQALAVFSTFCKTIVIKLGLFFIAVAVADFSYQKYNFGKEMKMEKFEVKQEYKNTEGDPHIKGKRKQIAQEIAYQEGPKAALQKSQALVTNPTHLAIALGYEQGIDIAPYIIAMGQDHLAEQMIVLAKQYNIPIIRNIKLAHTLWNDGDVYEFIPESTYAPIAEILRWIQSLGTELEYNYNPDKELPNR